VGVAGVLIQNILHHTRHAWLYDLVVDEAEREQSYGTELVEFVEEWRRIRAVNTSRSLHHWPGRTHQYYENRSYEKWGYIIEKEL